MRAEKTAAIVVIGNEVLSGKVEESNAVYLLRELRELGVPLKAIHVIPDDVDTIAATVTEASGKFDYVFTTGGIGPTHDDMTVPAIARGFGLELTLNATVEKLLHQFCEGGVNEHLLRMAYLPQGTELLWDNGLRFPVVQVRNVYIFPGDPGILRRKFQAIRHRFRADPFVLRKIFTTCDEGQIASLMETAEKRLEGVQIGSYPVYDNPEFKVQITIESKDKAKADETVEYLLKGIPTEKVVRVE